MSLLFNMLSRLVITFLPRSEHLWISWLWSPSAVILLPAAAKSLQSCLTLCDPMDCSVPGFSIMGFSRQEHWSGLSFPSPMHESESEVAQSCLTLSDPMDCSLPGSPIHGITLFNKDSILIQKRNQTLYRQTKAIRIQNHQTFMVNAEGSSLDQIRSVAQSCWTLWDPMICITPGLPVHHQLPEFTQTNVHCVSDAIQPSHHLSSPFPPAPNPSQHQSLFQWVNSSHEVAKVLEFQL